MKKIIFLTLLLFNFSFGQNNQDMKSFGQKVSNYLDKGKVNLANIEINNLKKKPNLKPIEHQYLYFYSGVYNKYLGKTDPAIIEFKKCLKYLVDNQITLNCYYEISDSFFTVQDFDNAYNYAKLAIDEMVFDEKNMTKKVDLISIISYKDYINGEYAKALKGYKDAITIGEKFDKCKCAEVENKIAKVYNVFNKLKDAKACIDRSLVISDSCKNEINKIKALKTWREILISRKMISESELVLEVLTQLERRVNIEKRNFDLDSIANNYIERIAILEKENLKRINEKQSKNLFWSNVALSIFCILFFVSFIMGTWIVKLFRSQKVVNNKLTEQKELIEQNNKDLNRLNLLNQKVFSVISHDFKGPLNTLKLLLKNYSKDKNQDIESYIKDISSQINQSDDVLNSLLDWSKSELNNVNEIEISFNLKELIEEVLNELKVRIKEKGILTLQKGTDDDVFYNRSALKIILRNLISNAIKYSFPEGIVEISYIDKKIEISDNGKGIKPALIDQLFKNKVASSVGTNFETGFGIGLYLSYELIRKNGGNISVKSENKTTVFSVDLYSDRNNLD